MSVLVGNPSKRRDRRSIRANPPRKLVGLPDGPAAFVVASGRLGPDHILICPQGFLGSFVHQPSPSEDQAGGEPMGTGNIADGHARLECLISDRSFCSVVKHAAGGQRRSGPTASTRPISMLPR